MFVDSKAQFFKTAEQLRIDERIYNAMVEVRRCMLFGKITEEHFDYVYWRQEDSRCGTACCIGGWMDMLYRPSNRFYYSLRDIPSRPLQALFYGGFSSRQYGRAPTMAMGIQAMENYLTTGWPRWKEVWAAAK